MPAEFFKVYRMKESHNTEGIVSRIDMHGVCIRVKDQILTFTNQQFDELWEEA